MLSYIWSTVWGAVVPWLAYIVPALLIAAPWAALSIPGFGAVLNKVLRWRPPIPLNYILAAVAFAWFGWQGAVMQAAKDAVAPYVAESDLAAAKAKAAKLQNDLDIANALRGAAEKRAAEAQAIDAVDAEATQQRIQSDTCTDGNCAVWTKEDIQWLSGKH